VSARIPPAGCPGSRAPVAPARDASLAGRDAGSVDYIAQNGIQFYNSTVGLANGNFAKLNIYNNPADLVYDHQARSSASTSRRKTTTIST
jgi:hypothetical protein